MRCGPCRRRSRSSRCVGDVERTFDCARRCPGDAARLLISSHQQGAARPWCRMQDKLQAPAIALLADGGEEFDRLLPFTEGNGGILLT